MKLNCNIIQDILPLVVEDLASEDTVKLINDHIETCPKCNEEYIKLKESKISYKSISKPETVPLKSIRRKLKNRNIAVLGTILGVEIID
jgi:predicted anti-sigma-YlaC factor YlaD